MMQGYKYVTSRRALEAAIEPLFSKGHIAEYAKLSPQAAAAKVVSCLAISLSTHDEHVPLRDQQSRPVKDEPESDDFFS